MKNFINLIYLLALSAYSQCTYTTSNPLPSSISLYSGQTLCVEGDYNASNTSIAVYDGGLIRIYNGSKFTVNGSLAVYGTGQIHIEDCNSKLWVKGSYQGVWNVCEIHVFCDTCFPNNVNSRFWKLIRGVENWRGMCCEPPLPVELIEFKVESKNCVDNIRWKTASEINNDYFVVEQSYNGIDWIPLSKIIGAGNSLEITEYSFKNNRTKDSYYYRLKQVDFNGNYEYSETISSKCEVIKPYVVKEFNLLGQKGKHLKKGLVFLLYNNGKVKKVYRK